MVWDQLSVVLSVELDAELALSKLIAAFKGEHSAAVNRKTKRPLTALAVAGHIFFLHPPVWLDVLGRFTIAATCNTTKNYATIVNILTQTAKLINAFIGKISTSNGVI